MEINNIEIENKTGFIYKLKSNSTEYIYIGSTTSPIDLRLRQHKNDFNKYINNKFNYITSFEIIGYNDCIIELLEIVEFTNKKDLLDKEAYYIRLNNNAINKCIPNRTDKEYYIDNIKHYKDYYINNKENIKKKVRQYQKDNKDKIKDYRNIKYDCQCGGKFTKCNKLRHEQSNKHIFYINNNV